MTDRTAKKSAHNSDNPDIATPDLGLDGPDLGPSDLGIPDLDDPALDNSALDAAPADRRDTDDAFTRDPDSASTEVARPDSLPRPGRVLPGSASNLQVLAAAVLAPLGYELLEVQVQNPGKRPTVVVRIDRHDEAPVSIEDLATSSKAVGAEYDRTDPIQGEYRLELESPGAKRPLLRARHFERMLGLKARVRGDGHSFTAPITAVDGEAVTFETTEGPLTLRIGQFQANLAEFPSEHR